MPSHFIVPVRTPVSFPTVTPPHSPGNPMTKARAFVAAHIVVGFRCLPLVMLLASCGELPTTPLPDTSGPAFVTTTCNNDCEDQQDDDPPNDPSPPGGGGEDNGGGGSSSNGGSGGGGDGSGDAEENPACIIAMAAVFAQ